MNCKADVNEASISVVIPCYCCADTIERAVNSVMAQTVLSTEVWLVEDGGGDGGRNLVMLYDLQLRYGNRVPIEVILLGRNFGCAVARNTGWDASTQPYIAFLDADDARCPQKLQIQYDWMRDHPNVAVTGHGWLWARSSQPDPVLPTLDRALQVSWSKQLISNRFMAPSVMMRRKLS